MLGINWFETHFSPALLRCYVQTFDDPEQSREVRDALDCPVAARFETGEVKLYAITANPPDGFEISEISVDQAPGVVQKMVKEGFGQTLRTLGFETFRRKVDDEALISTDRSVIPDTYTFKHGFKYRVYYGFKNRTSYRWGLILNYTTSQSFTSSLAADALRTFAVERRVLRLHRSSDFPHSGTLLKESESEIVVADRQGNEYRDAPANWTLQCRKEVLNDFVEREHGAARRREVENQIAQDSLIATAEGRANTSLARSQMTETKRLLDQFGLHEFKLANPDSVLVRLSTYPLEVTSE